MKLSITPTALLKVMQLYDHTQLIVGLLFGHIDGQDIVVTDFYECDFDNEEELDAIENNEFGLARDLHRVGKLSVCDIPQSVSALQIPINQQHYWIEEPVEVFLDPHSFGSKIELSIFYFDGEESRNFLVVQDEVEEKAFMSLFMLKSAENLISQDLI